MTVIIRPARARDSAALTRVVNPIIEQGGTTAHQSPFDAERLRRHYVEPERIISCQLAEVDGEAVGFQSLMWPDDEGDPFPDGWAIIASFVASGHAGKGIGRKLFEATASAGRAAGVATIDATIRADNTVGLTYYGAMGFQDYDVLPAIPLRDGTRVDRIRKRFDL